MLLVVGDLLGWGVVEVLLLEPVIGVNLVVDGVEGSAVDEDLLGLPGG